MPNFTTHLQLEKPTPEEFYDIGVQNGNMDKIDEDLTKRVPQTRTINKKSLSADVTLTGEDIPAGAEDATTLSSHLAELDSALSNKVTQFGKVSSELFDNPTHLNGYFASVDDGETSMPNIPAAGHWRLLYLPYFAATEGWAVQIAVGAVENSGLCWRKARGAEWQPWEFAATATPPEEIPLNLAEGWSGTANYFKTQECICVVELDIVKNTAVSNNEILATLPEGFRPSHARMYPAVVFAPHGSVAIAVHLTGEISIGDISGSPNARNIYATIVYKTAK